MSVDWTPLRRELAAWRHNGLELPIWWRDDDAVDVTPALRRLSAVSQQVGLPVHLAIVPRPASAALARYCAQYPGMIPMAHGWAHANHAPQGEKKSEFNHLRPDAERELRQALARLEALFGARLRKIFVPPWNRISPQITQLLAPLGYVGLSTFTPRKARLATPGLVQINTHLDPIHWRGGGGLRASDALVADLVGLLKDRREGTADRTEPLGILTHHLVHDEAIWAFSAACISELLDGGARAFVLEQTAVSLP